MRHEIFDLFHISHIIGSVVLTVLILYLANKFLKTQKQKNIFLKILGISTFILHIIPLWFNFLRDGETFVYDNMLFPIYYCNLTMFLLLITVLVENKQSKAFKYLAVMVAYASIIGSLVTLFYPDYYFASEENGLQLYKSFLSHDVMLISGIYLIMGGFVKIEHKNTIAYTIGLLFYGLVGLIVNFLFEINNLETPNAMYLKAPPIEDVPILSVYVVSLLTVLFVAGMQFIYLKITRKEESGKYLTQWSKYQYLST